MKKLLPFSNANVLYHFVSFKQLKPDKLKSGGTKFFVPLILIFSLFFTINKANAQYKGPKPNYTSPIVIGKSLPLTEIVPHTPLPKLEDMDGAEIETQTVPASNNALPVGNDPAWQKGFGTKSSITPYQNFEALRNSDNSGGVAPPDSDGDVGPNHYFAMVNNVFEIFDKTGTSLYGPAGNTTIWDGYVGPWTGQPISDPIVLYDEQADRWFVSVFTTSPAKADYYVLIAISTSPDPTGSYYRWAYTFANKPDYPKYGIWPDGYYLGLNSSGNDVCVFDRTTALAGGAPLMVSFDNPDKPVPHNTTFNCVLPSDCDGSFPSYGTPNYFMAIGDDLWPAYASDRLLVWEFHVDWSSPGSSTWTGPTAILTDAFNSEFNAFGVGEIPQPGTGQVLDAIPWVLMYRVQYRYFGSYSSIVCNHTVDVNGSNLAGIRWYELRKYGGGWYIRQQSTYSPDSDNRWMGSIAMNGEGDIALGYSVSSSSTYPSIRYTGRLYNDDLNEMTFEEESIIEGAHSQDDSRRWGDYSMMSVDPVDDKSFWYISEYEGNYGGWADWITQVAAFNLGDYCAAGSNSTSWEYISNVNVGSINNPTGSSGYADYTALSTDIPLNSSETITVTNGYGFTNDECGIWVDWNRDNDFDDTYETISVTGSPGPGSYTATIDPPASATTGDCIMRIRITYNKTPEPCGYDSFGEVEDYTITVAPSVPNYWTGNYNNYWGNGSNWSLGHFPTADEDVIIPNVNMPCIVDYSDKTCHDITIESGATVQIYDQALDVTDDATVYGSFELLHTAARLNIDDNIIWKSGSTGSMTGSATIDVTGNWNFESGANVQFSSGYINFSGSGDSYIRCYEDNCSIYHLRNYKNGAGDVLLVSGMSTEDFHITGNIYNYSSSTFNIYSSYSVILDGFFNNMGGDFYFEAGTFVFNGNPVAVDLKPNVGNYFNNLIVNVSTSLTLDNTYTNELLINGDIEISSGTLYANDFEITVMDNWTNSGTGTFDPGTSLVIFDSYGFHQDVNGNCTFYDVQQVNEAKYLRLNSTSGSTTVLNDLELNYYCYAYNDLDVNGELNIDNSISKFVAVGSSCNASIGSLNQGGTIICNGGTVTVNDLLEEGIYGTHHVISGTMNLHQDGSSYIDINGDVTIDDGEMNLYGSFGTNCYFGYDNDASLTISGGILDIKELGILVSDSHNFVENITDGLIRTVHSFRCNRVDFTPTGGTLELYGGTDADVFVYPGSTLFDVNINKSGGDKSVVQFKDRNGNVTEKTKSNAVSLITDLVVTNELTITDGSLTLDGNELTVARDCYVYGTLNMTNAADILNVGASYSHRLWFYSGSTGNLSEGVANIYGWFQPLSGCSVTGSVNHTVVFKGANGGGPNNFEPTTTYGNIEIYKNAGSRTFVSAQATEPINIIGDLTVHSDNEFELQSKTVNVHGTVLDQPTSEIYIYETKKDGKNGALSDNDKTGKSSTSKGGYLEIDNDFTLNGLMDVGDGDVLMHGEFEIATTGTLNIDGGSVVSDVPYPAKGWEYIRGTFNMTDGLFEKTYNSPNFAPTATTNISGGIIRSGAGFNTSSTAGVFVPTGGVVEFIGNSEDGNILCYPGNSFYDLKINCTTGYTVHYWENTTVTNNLIIDAGAIECYYNSGTEDLYIGGNWINNVGSGGFIPNLGTVIFNGTNDVTITPDETFYNLTLDKATDADWLTLSDDITVLNDFVNYGGSLHTGSNTLDVNGNVNIDGGTLFVQAGGTLKVGDNKSLTTTSGSNFFIEGNSSNYATLTHSGSGRYACEISGEIAANYAIFEYMNGNGVYLFPGALINPTYTFNHCIFQNGAPAKGSAYLVLHESNTFTAYDTYFDNSSGNVGNNVWKNVATGNATFQAANGDFAGPEYELDIDNRVHWTDMDVELDIALMLEGAFNGTDMNTDLNTLGLIPLNQPFDSKPSADWYYTGSESVGSIPPDVVDWVLVKIKDASNAAGSLTAPIVAEQAAFLLNDGSVVDLDGSSSLDFSAISYSNGLFPVLYHRNHLGVISSDKMIRIGGIYTWDFTQAGSAYSNTNPGEKLLGSGIYGMYSGDVSGGGKVNTTDFLWWYGGAGKQGYLFGDCNLNSQSDNIDKNDFLYINIGTDSQIPGSKNSDE